jgi:hypothetical protein
MQMNLEGYTKAQILHALKVWEIETPIEVASFLGRQDIPSTSLDRVRRVMLQNGSATEVYKLAQVEIMLEAVKLDNEFPADTEFA